MLSRTAHPRGNEEEPSDECAGIDQSRPMPAFLRPETHEPDARDDALPRWTRPPVDWREEHDLVVRGPQQRGLSAPGAPDHDNPSALRLKLPSPRAAARPAEAGTTHRDGAWIRRPYLFVPREDGAWIVKIHNSQRVIGTVVQGDGQVELRRADHWSTLLATVEQKPGQRLLEPPLVGLTLGLAHRVFSTRWPAGPPTVRLPDEYTQSRKKAAAPHTAAAGKK